MGYQKAEQILPQELIRAIQQYADGICIYIPRKENSRKKWGENTDTLSEIQTRNQYILKDRKKGMSVTELSAKYFLSEKSIQRILRQNK